MSSATHGLRTGVIRVPGPTVDTYNTYTSSYNKVETSDMIGGKQDRDDVFRLSRLASLEQRFPQLSPCPGLEHDRNPCTMSILYTCVDVQSPRRQKYQCKFERHNSSPFTSIASARFPTAGVICAYVLEPALEVCLRLDVLLGRKLSHDCVHVCSDGLS